MNSNKLLYFDILEQLYENLCQLPKYHFKRDDCLIITGLDINNIYKKYFIDTSPIIYKDFEKSCSILYNTYMFAIANQSNFVITNTEGNMNLLINELNKIIDTSYIII